MEAKATIVDAVRLWLHMRDIDREEAGAASRVPVLLTLLWGVLFTEVVALRAGGELLALYGVRTRGRDRAGRTVGLIWMLSTGAVARHKRDVVDACAAYVAKCARSYDVLYNFVYAKNDIALRFVQRLGFLVNRPFTARGAKWHLIVRLSCAA